MLILSTNVDKKSVETEFTICDKLQSNSLFLAIFDRSSSIIKNVFDCRLSSVEMQTAGQFFIFRLTKVLGAQWLSGRVLDSRPRGRGFEPHRSHCLVVLEQDTFILAWYWFNPGRPVPV